MALLFPWLFTNGRGHYAMVPANEPDIIRGNQIVPEEQGGIPDASRHFTLNSYVKQQLLNIDRRFGQDPSFLFWAVDSIEKRNIHSANRHTVRTGSRVLQRQNVMDNEGNYNRNEVTIVPHTIRTSYAYKRKHYLNLKTMCEELGAPQIFMTFSCDDLAQEFKNATNEELPWKDPVIFALHFRRKWKEFFTNYIMHKWSRMIGGITDWTYVMEIQGKKKKIYIYI